MMEKKNETQSKAQNKQGTPQKVDPKKIKCTLGDGVHIIQGSRVVVKDFADWPDKKKLLYNQRYPRFFTVSD